MIGGTKFTICNDFNGLVSPSCISSYEEFMSRKQEIMVARAEKTVSKPKARRVGSMKHYPLIFG